MPRKRSTLVFILFFSLPISLLFFSFFNFSFTEKVDFDNKEIDNRFCYDATYSHLNLEIFLSEKKIKGFNKMVFHSGCDISQIVIDLTESMIVDSVYLSGELIDFFRKKDKILVKSDFSLNDIFEVIVFYRGKPVISKNLPWDGGFVWENKLDSSTQVGVACQMDGASIWWPNKDDLSDEVDSMRMSFIVEKPYSVISNGQLEGVRDLGMRKQFDWFVENPINNYNVTIRCFF